MPDCACISHTLQHSWQAAGYFCQVQSASEKLRCLDCDRPTGSVGLGEVDRLLIVSRLLATADIGIGCSTVHFGWRHSVASGFTAYCC